MALALPLLASLVATATLFSLMLYFNRSILLKIATATALFVASNLVYFSLPSYKGWPLQQRIIRGNMIHSQVFEPQNGKPGAIFLWVVPSGDELSLFERLFAYRNSDSRTPRSFEVPYSESFSRKIQKAQKKIESGYVVIIGDSKMEETDDSGEMGKNATPNKKTEDRGEGAENYDAPHLQILNPTRLLRKD